jgi:transposase-like protein
MSKGSWREGRRAWERLAAWGDDTTSTAGRSTDGAGALEALADIGFIRRGLDQAELGAVRTARRNRKSWAEIATRLGVSRQSAWERWRDLDETEDGSRDSTLETAVADAAAEQVTLEREAIARRRQSTVVVPSVIGLSANAARTRLGDVGLISVASDPDGPPLSTLAQDGVVVTDQSPEAGAKVPAGSRVTLWVGRDDGGSAGVREPRRPKPTPLAAREQR